MKLIESAGCRWRSSQSFGCIGCMNLSQIRGGGVSVYREYSDFICSVAVARRKFDSYGGGVRCWNWNSQTTEFGLIWIT